MEYIKIGSIVRKISSGGTPKSTKKEYYGGNIPWLNTKEINFNRIYKTEKSITKDGLNNSSAKYIKENCVIVAMYGATAGRVAINKIPLTTNQACCNIEVDENKMDYNYLYYAIKNDYERLASFANGGAQQNLNSVIIKEFEIPHFDIKTQKKISKILTNIDKKIELNNEINNNLLEILKSIYKEKYYIKEENRVSLSALIKETIGGDWGKEQQEGNYIRNVYCIRGADIPQMVYGNKGSVPSRYILEKNYNNKKLKPNEIIIEISGGSPTQSTGRTAFISEKIIQTFEIPIVCTNFCRAIEFLDEKYAPYVYLHLLCLYDNKIFFNYENGTTGIKNLKLTDLLNKEYISIPSNEELLNFYDLFNALFNKIVENSDENQNLEQLRDILLPKLMNDEIDLENIEI